MRDWVQRAASSTPMMRGTAVAGCALLASLVGIGQAHAWDMRVCSDPNRLPFSSESEPGFENRIADLLAEELGATVSYIWLPQTSDTTNDYLRTGECDVIMGVQDGDPGVISTLAYYRSPFVFLYRQDAGFEVNMFDDPDLQNLRIAVQPSESPAGDALFRRGLLGQIVAVFDYGLTPIIEAVENKDVDVAVLWGPAAGYFAPMQEDPLVVAPVTPEFEPPFIPMFVNITIGVRRGDEALRDDLDRAIASRWDDILAVLDEFNIPQLELPRPLLTLGTP